MKEEEKMIDMERKDIKMATLYELRLLIDSDKREEFTKQEISQLLDAVAMAKAGV